MRVTTITTTFSPTMLGIAKSAKIREVHEKEFLRYIKQAGDFLFSAIGHENTANILSRKLNHYFPYNRTNISLDYAAVVIAAIPQFRADQAREFTDEEVAATVFRYFVIRT